MIHLPFIHEFGIQKSCRMFEVVKFCFVSESKISKGLIMEYVVY
jgi:hypothetical protein